MDFGRHPRSGKPLTVPLSGAANQPDISAMTKKELLDLANSLRLDGVSGTKAQMQEQIRGAMG